MPLIDELFAGPWGPLIIFGLRLVDVSLATLRMLLSMRNQRVAAPIIGIVAPNSFGVLPSILMVIWVAVGGRGTLYGAAIGALVVNWGRVLFSESRPDEWLYLQGALFIIVIVFVPGGIMGLLRRLRAVRAAALPDQPSEPPAAPETSDHVASEVGG
jgi:hypothetical protein